MEVKKIDAWKCPVCQNKYEEKYDADYCFFDHLKKTCINNDFKRGLNLCYIVFKYGLHLELTDKQKEINKDNCFKISYLQCCDEPAYQITHISSSGEFTVNGCGSWSGYYSSKVRLDCLEDPRPKEELFVAK